MRDDDEPNIVRSGVAHSVRVSERTGNAKTPQNKITSHEEERIERQTQYAQKLGHALDDDENESVGHVVKARTQSLTNQPQAPNINRQFASEGNDQGNIQKVDAGKAKNNVQLVNGSSPSDRNVQKINSDLANQNIQKVDQGQSKDNIQSIGNGHASDANIQSVGKDRITDNLQTIGQGHFGDNIQKVSSGQTQANTQSINQENTSANIQSIGKDRVTDNHQSLNKENVDANIQGIGKENTSTNNQSLGKENTSTNNQSLGKENTSTNNQSLGKENTSTNNQSLGKQPFSDNQALAASSFGQNTSNVDQQNVPTNHQTAPQAVQQSNWANTSESAAGAHQAAIAKQHPSDNNAHLDSQNHLSETAAATSGLHHNDQGVPNAPIENRSESADQPKVELNRQGTSKENLQTNLQAAPSDTIAAKNFQNLPNEGTHDHFVKLPPAQTPRSAPQLSQTSNHNPEKRPLSTGSKPNHPPSMNLSSVHGNTSKAMDEFHGRLKGIKQEVDVLNNRLTKFEEQIHKKPADE